MEAEKEGGGKGMELGLEELGGWGEGEEECERDGEIVKGEQQRIFRADSPLEGLELEMEKDSTVHLTSEPISESPEFESDPADTGEHTQHRPPRKNIPLPKNMSQCHGRIASTLLPRLTQLTLQLPTSDLRLRASSTLSRIESLTQTPYSGSCPIVLTHGDLIPSNLLLSPQTWDIVGVVDWAEAEYLPFGICLYGLEFVLGSISTSDPSPHFLPTSASDHDPRPWTPTFVYHPRAPELRRVFLQSLGELVPHLGREEVREEVGIWRDVGVLLWFGFAWDEGRIDRVVEVGRDGVEVECLGAFLGVDWVADEEV
ncbi:hypothetical protein BCR34DRAFT_574688 [Clohesyomyces aquaticus]|uniref:Aminoglycoside phosphotransferase domain-containing protein n=1 Tax=Clohesyomyces aquaticus TaxID=1231657 RepID=A0A1Y1YUE5_9PLEO|nr:hypothetical protein BCR34DRAFT_574688 [Clohesyomyces aquaticus]